MNNLQRLLEIGTQIIICLGLIPPGPRGFSSRDFSALPTGVRWKLYPR